MSGRQTPVLSTVMEGNWRGNFWIWATPLLFFVGAIVFAVLTLRWDRAAALGIVPEPVWAVGGGAGESQAILTVIAGASISALTLVFSSALVVLTLAASQFGSFLLHDFIRMRISRLTLSMFVATFVYSLMVLARIGEGPSAQFVPQISTKVAMLLAFISLGLLIAFIFSISLSVQAQQVAAMVAATLRHAIAERQRATAREGGAGRRDDAITAELAEATRRLADDGVTMRATKSGYLQVVAYRKLVRAARHADCVVRLAFRPGQYVLTGSVLAEVAPSRALDARLRSAIQTAHHIGPERTLQQDLEFAIDKLVQIALLALSAAINNTFNALICLDWLGDGLRMLAEQHSEGLVYHDAHAAIRVIEHPLPFTDVLDAAFGKIRYASGGNPTVVIHLLLTIGRLAPYLPTEEQRDALAAHARAATEFSLSRLTLDVDRTAVLGCYAHTCEMLGRAARPVGMVPAPVGPAPAPSPR